MRKQNVVTVLAPAKLNLALDVVGLLPNGYHDLDMTMQAITLYERVVLRRSPYLNLRLPGSLVAPNNKNTAIKAALAFFDYTGLLAGVDITIYKNTPVRAGMAGGSADAAAVLVGMNELYGAHLSMSELCALGAKIGADVPFCIMRGTALAEGIGEELTPLPAMPHCSLVIAKPKIHVSTKFVYGNLKVGELTEHPDIDGQVQALRENNLEQLVTRMGNVLETVTIPAYPVIDEIKHTMMKYGAMGAMMSGSGPTVFGIFEKEDKAQEVCRLLKKEKAAKQVYLVRQ